MVSGNSDRLVRHSVYAFSYLNQYSIRAFFSESSVTEKINRYGTWIMGRNINRSIHLRKRRKLPKAFRRCLPRHGFNIIYPANLCFGIGSGRMKTYKLGIVPGLLMAILLLVLLLIFWDHEKHWNLSGMQRLVLGCILFAFLCVGLIVSVKIGGGSNLHNLDMFLYCSPHHRSDGMECRNGWMSQSDKVHSILDQLDYSGGNHPSGSAGHVFNAEPKKYPDPSTTGEALAKVQQVIAQHAQEEILMDQRQLRWLSDMFPKFLLIADYEKNGWWMKQWRIMPSGSNHISTI